MFKKWIKIYRTELEKLEKTLQKYVELKQIYHDHPQTISILDKKIKTIEQAKIDCEKTLIGLKKLKKRYS